MLEILLCRRWRLSLRFIALLAAYLLAGCSSLEKYQPPIDNFSTRTTELTKEFELAITGTNESFRRHEYGQLRGPKSHYKLNSLNTVDLSRKAKEITAWESRNPDPNREKREPIVKVHPVPEEVQRGVSAALLELANLSKVLGDLANNDSSDAHFSAQIKSVSSFMAAAGEVITAYDKNLFAKEGLSKQFTTLGERFSALSGLLGEIAASIANGKRKRAIKYAGEKALPEVEAMIEPLAVILYELTKLEKEYLVARRNELADLLRKDGFPSHHIIETLENRDLKFESFFESLSLDEQAAIRQTLGPTVNRALDQELTFKVVFVSLEPEERGALLQLFEADWRLDHFALNQDLKTFLKTLSSQEREAFLSFLNSRPQFDYSDLQAITLELEFLNTRIRELDDVRRPLRRARIEKFAEAIDNLKKVTGHGSYELPQSVISILDDICDKKVKIQPPKPPVGETNESGGDNNG